MTSDEAVQAREGLLRMLESILGPDPLDGLRAKLTAEFGIDIALPVMRIVRPVVEAEREQAHQMLDTCRSEVNGAARIRTLHQQPPGGTVCHACGHPMPCPTIRAFGEPLAKCRSCGDAKAATPDRPCATCDGRQEEEET